MSDYKDRYLDAANKLATDLRAANVRLADNLLCLTRQRDRLGDLVCRVMDWHSGLRSEEDLHALLDQYLAEDADRGGE